tara:strand:+ start:1443 stop:2375 length:933 start_codon:yes stop_codon:yes gene_type:complete
MKILIELPSWIGDTVMATPAIENIINYYNKSEITVIGSFASTEIIRNHPKVVKTQAVKKNYFSLFNTAKNLGKFDIFFSFRGSMRSRIFKLVVSSRLKYQINTYDYQNSHQVERYNRFINNCLKTSFKAGKLKIFSSLEATLITSDSKPIVGINPGATYGEAKRWYPQEFAKVATKLSSKYKILIFGGQNEIDISSEIERILIGNGIKNFQNFSGKTSISELINLISSLDLFITGDSGPMHIAASFQVPTISIFGPTRDSETAQWMNERSIVLKGNLDCQPCMKRKCPLKHHNCMKTIKASNVLNAIESL